MIKLLDKFLPIAAICVSAGYIFANGEDLWVVPLALLSLTGWISYWDLRDRQHHATEATHNGS